MHWPPLGQLLQKWPCQIFSKFKEFLTINMRHKSLLVIKVDQNIYPWGVWQYGLWSFQTGDTKLDRFFPKNQQIQTKLLNFEFSINGELSNSAKIWLSKSIFYVKNHPNLSQFFFFEEYQFRSTFYVIDIFW